MTLLGTVKAANRDGENRTFDEPSEAIGNGSKSTINSGKKEGSGGQAHVY